MSTTPTGVDPVIGTVTTGAAGSNASVTATGATLDFTIPRGDTGATGPQGIQGPAGSLSGASDGTAAAPSISFSADTNTGLFRPGADQIGFTTGGTSAMTISGSNVGIGTAPATNLHVNSASNTILSITGGSAAFLRTKDTGGPVDEKHWDLLNDNGNVVWRFVNDANSAVSTIYNAVRSGNTVSRHAWYVGTNSEVMSLTSSGSLGLGTSAPAVPLHISSTTPSIRLTDTDDNSDAQIGAAAGGLLVFDADINNEAAGSAILFRVDGGSEKMRLTSSGLLGLGTSAPAVELEIASAQPELRLTDTDGTDQESTFVQAGGTLYLNLQNDTNNGAFRVRGFASGSPTDHFLVNGSGNVGIGTSVPSTKTEISTNNEASILRLTDTATIGAVNRKVGGLEFYQNDASGGAGVGSSIAAHHANVSGDTDLRFATGDNTEHLRLTSSGSLALGTSSPVSLLHAKSTIPVVTADSSGFAGAGNGTGFGIYRSAAGRTAGYTWTITNAISSGGSGASDYQTDNLVFSTRAATTDSTLTEAMRLAPSGTVTANGILKSGSTGSNGQFDLARASDGLSVGKITMTESSQVMNYNNVLGSGIHSFSVNNTERMRCNSSGNVGIQVSNPATALDVTNGYIRSERVQGGYGNAAGNFHIDSKTGTAGVAYLNWFQGTGGVNVGNGASGYGTIRAAAFTVSSDRRLKENISYFDRGLAEILQLKPATFDFINGENNQKGFIAQDVETVIPEAVGTTTMSDSNGNVDETDTYLTINNSAIIPYLVAAIKEQQTIIESLEARVAALETA